MPVYALEAVRLAAVCIALGPFVLSDPGSPWIRGAAFLWMVVILCDIAVFYPLVRRFDEIDEHDYHLGAPTLGSWLVAALGATLALAGVVTFFTDGAPWSPWTALLFCGIVAYAFPLAYLGRRSPAFARS